MMQESSFKKKYNNVDNLPPHVFMNRDMTRPVGKEFIEYLAFLIKHNPETLRYIHRKAQEYVDYGGANQIPFNKWIQILSNHINNKGNSLNEETTTV